MTPPPRRRRRWIAWTALALVLLLLAAVAALPAWLGTPPARRWLLAKANAVLAPARVDVQQFHFSWFGPTRLKGVTLRDATGTPVLQSPAIAWSRTLSRILRGGPLRGTFDVEALLIDVVREPDGDVTLADALRPILQPNPAADWVLRSRDGRFLLHAPELKRPIDCRLAAIELRRPPGAQPFGWSMTLAETDGAGRLALEGSIQNAATLRPGAKPEQTIRVAATTWPLDLDADGGSGTARLEGRTNLASRAGLWSVAGDARLAGLVVTPAGAGAKPLTLGDVKGDFDLSQAEAGWTVRALNLDGALGTIRTESATIGRDAAAKFTGELDLANLAALVPDRLPLGAGRRVARGTLALAVTAEPIAGAAPAVVPKVAGAVPPPPAPGIGPDGPAYRLVADLDLRDLRLADAEGGDALDVPPHRLAFTADLGREGGTIDLPALTLSGPTGKVEATGRIAGWPDAPRGDLDATLSPDWDRVRRELAERVDPDATLAGGPLRVRIAGPLEAPADANDLATRWRIDLDATLESADVWGMTLGPAALAAHVADGGIRVEPIASTLNGGPLRLAPRIELQPGGAAVVRLDRESFLQDAEITEEVSRRLLTYLVPVVERTARARGFLSLQIDEATLPVDDLAHADVRGLVVFRDAEFTPGPIADEVLDLLRRDGDRTVRLEKPVLLAIADGKVYQRDLSVKLGNVARLQLDGTVGFDQSLDLLVRIPLQAERFADVPVFGQIAPAMQVSVPVTGTLAQPKVDAQAFARGLGRTGLDIAEGAAMGGLDALLQNALRPRTPEEQAAAAQRQAERQARQEERRRMEQERRAERRMRRGR
jgi:hypothetical protein